MIKKYKIACCVLGAIVLVLILALAITVFVFAGNIKAADGVENASGDIADTISEAVFLTTSYVGMVIFVFAIIVGCLLLLYLIAYAAFTRGFTARVNAASTLLHTGRWLSALRPRSSS